MFKMTFTNSEGENIQMGASFPYVLGRCRGLSSGDVSTQLSKGFNQNGSYYYGSLDEPRVISMTVFFSYLSDLEGKQKRKTIARVFNPRLGMGQIKYEDKTGVYLIDAVVSVKPEIYKLDNEEYTRTRAFDVVFTCPKPDWMSYHEHSIKMVDFVGGLQLPFCLPITLAERGDGGRITYDGDNPASCLLDFRVAQGGTSVVNPRVENHLGEYIKVNKTLSAGQKILIDTNPDAPSITFVDTDGSVIDAWESLVYGSKFFQLMRGENVFKFTADSGQAELYLTYRNHYSGV